MDFKDTTNLFYARVREEYAKMTGIKKNGRQVFNHDYIIAEIAAKYFRRPKTIENIVFNRVAPKKRAVIDAEHEQLAVAV